MPFIKTPEIDIHYESGGDGKEVVLLLHGNFASWRWWQPILKNMPRGYRAYAPDLRGCGDSDKPEADYAIPCHAADVNRLVSALKIKKFHLVGHSLGGCIALEYALAHPRRIKTLTLVAPAPNEGQSLINDSQYSYGFLNSAGTMQSAFRLSESLGTYRKTLSRALARMMPPDGITGDFEALVDDAARMSHDAAVGHIETLLSWNVQKAVPKLDLPVLIIGGREDRLIPAEALQNAAEKFPNCRLIIWPGMGHTPQLVHPQRFTQILQKFFRQHSNPNGVGICTRLCAFFEGSSHSQGMDDFAWHHQPL